MASTKKSLKKNPPSTVLPTATSSLTPATVSDPPDPPEITTSSTPVWSTTPPSVTVPAAPTGFVPVNFKQYRGSHPKAGQITALPDAIAELEASSTYSVTFGSSVPAASMLASELATAARWTALRTATESFLLYTRSMEAITWKSALVDLEKLDSVFQAVAAQNPAAVVAFPATQRLLDVPKVIAVQAAASRARTAKAKAAGTSSTAVTPTTPVVTAAAPLVANVVVPGATGSGTGGGAAH